MTDVNMRARTAALLDVVRLRRPLAEGVLTLGSFAWDCDVELVALRRADAVGTVERYLRDAISADDLRRWAEVLEGRDDLGLEPLHENVLKDFLTEIANPEIFESINPEVAIKWLRRLVDG
jgi:hypothetical protein